MASTVDLVLLGLVHDQSRSAYDIQKNIEESLSFITITRQQKKNIPLVGRTSMKQQIMVLDSLQKWCIEFKQEIENEESLEKMQELGGE